LKELRLWPKFEERRERSIYQFIESSIKTQFRQNKAETNPLKIEELVAVAEKELQSMRNLLSNKYFHQFPPKGKPAPLASYSRVFLSTRYQKEHVHKKGLFSKIRNLFWRKAQTGE
jgi:hypothetical protein